MWYVIAHNVFSNDYLELGKFGTHEEACGFTADDFEWDVDDVISEWQILVSEDWENFEILIDFTVESDWDDEPYDLEEGFDPYCGCYTYDC